MGSEINLRNSDHESRIAAERNAGKWASGALLTLGLLAASAIVVRNKTRQAEQRHPPLGQFIEIDGVRLHYVERGQGRPLLLLHGNGDTVEDLHISGMLDRAATDYRVIAFDRPGFGHSERPRNRTWGPAQQAAILHKALLQLGIERPIIVGHSWGTLVALAMALDYPGYARSLVLLAGYYYPSIRPAVPMLSVPAIPGVGDVMRHTLAPLLGRLMWPAITKRIFSPSAVPPRFSKFPMWMSLRPKQLRASAAETAWMIPATMAMQARYAELNLPVVILAGHEDAIVDTHHNSVRLHNEIRDSELDLISGTGHMVHYLIQDEIMAAIHRADEMRGESRPVERSCVGGEVMNQQYLQ